jgi:hypothetical protein
MNNDVFSNLPSKTLLEKIKQLGFSCGQSSSVFHFISSGQNKDMRLKEEYKSQSTGSDLYSVYHELKKGDINFVGRVKDKLRQKSYWGQTYENPEASLKMHISLNDIGEVDVSVILGLIQLLKEETESSDNNLSFNFKIIDPRHCNDVRFKMNDQLTIYFDNYSSAGDLLRLADKVDCYLKKHVPVNQCPLGPKDRFGLSSFVSARFDTNKLLSEYNVYPFFDLELKKFFEKHTDEELENLPLCAFEVVFNTILSSDITIPMSGFNTGLSEEDSKKVALEFEKILKNPKEYMFGEQHINAPNSLSDSLDPLNETLKNTLRRSNEEDQALLAKSLSDFMASKDNQFNANFILLVASQKNKLLPLEIELPTLQLPPKLNQVAVEHFSSLLEKFKAKGQVLKNNGYKDKAQAILILSEKLDMEFSQYREGKSNYTAFETSCCKAITDAMPVLEKHRGLKEILVNLWEAIKTFGVSLD